MRIFPEKNSYGGVSAVTDSFLCSISLSNNTHPKKLKKNECYMVRVEMGRPNQVKLGKKPKKSV